MRHWTHKSIQALSQNSEIKDPIAFIRNKARALVLDAISKGWEGPPYSPSKLAQLYKIEVRPSEFIKDARISVSNDNPLIEYNPNRKSSRINFSIAHEISHAFFPDWKEEVRNREPKSNLEEKELEFLCDIGASEILLPYSRFSMDANSLATDLESLFFLSKKYQASLESVFLRYCEVINSPCTVLVCSRENDLLKLEYSKSSKRSTISIPYDYLIPKDSVAYNCFRPGHTDNAVECWDVFDDRKFHIYTVGLSPLKGTTSSRVGVFIQEEPKQAFINDNRFKEVNGDATEPRGDGSKIIVQVVNTIGAMGAGFGRAIKQKWPIAETSIKELKKESNGLHIGSLNLIKLENDVSLFQIVAQKGIRNKKVKNLLDYQALRKGLKKLAEYSIESNSTIHMPPIGSGFGGGDWNIIKGMIFDELISENLSVTVYFLPGTKKDKSEQIQLFSG